MSAARLLWCGEQPSNAFPFDFTTFSKHDAHRSASRPVFQIARAPFPVGNLFCCDTVLREHELLTLGPLVERADECRSFAACLSAARSCVLGTLQFAA